MRLIDFGLMEDVSVGNQTVKHWGDARYRSPEVVLDLEWSFAVDIWSLAYVSTCYSNNLIHF